MRRLSYNQKQNSSLYQNYGKTNQFRPLDQLSFRLDFNQKLFSSGPQQPYISSRESTKYELRKRTNELLIAKTRPSTTQRSSSLNEFKKQRNLTPYKKNNFSTAKVSKESARNKSYHNDSLLIGSHFNKKIDEKQKISHSFRNNDSLYTKTKINRGTSNKNENYQDGLFLKDYSFDSTKRHFGINDNYIISRNDSRDKKVADMLAKTFRQSFTPQPERRDDFFQYIMRFSYKTKKGYTPSNPNKINQDSFIVSPNINNKTWQHLFGVCDGHGPLGHLVSKFVKETLPQCFNRQKNADKNPVMAFNKAFESTFDRLIKQSHIDLSFSGSTVIVCYLLQNRLFCCNVGDSRAILGKQKDNCWRAQPLSIDHKPSLPSEAERIRKSKGRVESYKDEYGENIGPLRVWLKNQNIPGLAMTRSFGDLVGASVGVSHQPEIKQFLLSSEDKIILIGSDGVFEFMSNEQIIGELSGFYDRKQVQQGADHLLGLAHRSWTKNSSIVDDITFVLIFMNYEE